MLRSAASDRFRGVGIMCELHGTASFTRDPLKGCCGLISGNAGDSGVETKYFGCVGTSPYTCPDR